MAYIIAAAVVLFELLGAQATRAPFPRPHHHLAKREADYFNWTAVEPSPHLQYTPCFDTFECARLQMPLDWNNTDPSFVDNVAIAVMRLPAKVAVTDPRYGGPILINPGGPGGSGVDWLRGDGVAIQTLFDAAYENDSSTYVVNSSTAKYFDIVGFDPRGVSNSTPFLSCLEGGGSPTSWGGNQALGTLEAPLELLWQENVASNEECLNGPGITPNGSVIADFTSTVYVARDVVEIAERHSEWLERQSNGFIKWNKGEEPIQFFGVSYGTILGATLAAMQPHRVKRFLLDGVASSSQYYGGLITSDNKQADATYERFFEYCALAGPDNCTMWAGNSSADTQRLYQSILDNINDEGPIPVTGSAGPALIHLSDVLTYGSNMLYTPDQFFSLFADAIAPLAERNGTLLANLLPSSVATLAEYFDPYDPNTYVVFDGYPQNAIVGADATGVRYNTSDAYEHVWHELQNVTRWTGNLTAAEYLAQFSWPSNPKWQYGPAKPISSNATAAPILFASNLIDGVTSLQSAQEMHAAFPSSGLLLNDGQGHTTASSPGLELAKKFRYYFQTGELPWNLSTPTLPYSRPLLGTDGPRIAPFNSTNATLEDQALFNASIGLD